jgi:hypothetical protein
MRQKKHNSISEVLRAVWLRIHVLWEVTSCRPLKYSPKFRRILVDSSSESSSTRRVTTVTVPITIPFGVRTQTMLKVAADK